MMPASFFAGCQPVVMKVYICYDVGASLSAGGQIASDLRHQPS